MIKIYGLIGYPIKNSLSPFIHNFLFRTFSISAEYHLFEKKNLSFIEMEKYKSIPVYGFSITMPYKNYIYNFYKNRFTSVFLPFVNTLKLKKFQYVSYNTDLYGIYRVLLDIENLKSKQIFLLGSGALAQLYIYSLYTYFDVKNIFLITRNHYNNSKIKENILIKYPNKEIKVYTYENLFWDKADLLINATPIGMNINDTIPFDMKNIKKECQIIDSVYHKHSVLKKEAEKMGIKYLSGIKMLIYQAIRQHEIWKNYQIKNHEKMYQKIYDKIAAQGIEPRTSGL